MDFDAIVTGSAQASVQRMRTLAVRITKHRPAPRYCSTVGAGSDAARQRRALKGCAAVRPDV